jgi:nuclear transcription Y subunit beta
MFKEDIENDEYLPISNIAKIMKNVLDKNTKISREAKNLVQESVTEFICFITSESSDKCKKEKRKTGRLFFVKVIK